MDIALCIDKGQILNYPHSRSHCTDIGQLFHYTMRKFEWFSLVSISNIPVPNELLTLEWQVSFLNYDGLILVLKSKNHVVYVRLTNSITKQYSIQPLIRVTASNLALSKYFKHVNFFIDIVWIFRGHYVYRDLFLSEQVQEHGNRCTLFCEGTIFIVIRTKLRWVALKQFQYIYVLFNSGSVS